MKTKVVQIGNSKGIRIPKKVLEELGGAEEVYMEANGGKIIISPVKEVRSDWASKFKKMATNKDDLLIDDSPNQTSWDEKEWEWK